MIGGSSEKQVKHILDHIDNNIWESVADKAISKMPRFKLTLQSERMFHDFTIMTNQISGNATKPLKQQSEHNGKIHQSLLVGTSKIEPNNRRTVYPTEIVQKSQKQIKIKRQKLKSAVSFINDKIIAPEVKINTLINLCLAKNQNEQEQRGDQILRTTKYQNMRYNQQIQLYKKNLEAESKHRSHTEQKRFRQMKQFTYDYSGHFLALDSNKNANIKVINMKHKYGNNIKSHSLGRHMGKGSRASQIQHKKIVGHDRMSTIQLLKEKEKEKDRDDKLIKYLNSERPKVNSFELFKSEKAVSTGVNIIDLNTSQQFLGRIIDKGNNKNLSLRQYQNQTKYVESIKQKINIKQGKSQRYVMKTEYYESTYDNNRPLKTQGTEKQSKVLTSLTRFVKNRGKIIIQDSKLYSENFTEDLN